MVVIYILNYIITASLGLCAVTVQEHLEKRFFLSIVNRNMKYIRILYGLCVLIFTVVTINFTYLGCSADSVGIYAMGIGLRAPGIAGTGHGYYANGNQAFGSVFVLVRSRPVE